MPKPSAKKIKSTPKQLWLGCFSLLDDDDRSASFQAVAQAKSVADAAEAFETRIRALRETSSLFDGDCKVYLDAMFELTPDAVTTPTIVNFTSKREGEKVILWCPLPEQPDAQLAIWGEEEEEEEEDGEREPFVTFTAKKPSRRPARASRPPGKSMVN